jgi:hypothetical protein
MSALKVQQVKARLEEMFGDKIDTGDIAHTDGEREAKLYSRYLAAYGIFNLAGCDEATAAGAVWDGSDDNGIDAAFYDPVERTVFILQSKWMYAGTGEPDATSVNTLAVGVKDLIEQDHSAFHKRLEGKLIDIAQAVVTPGTVLKIILISTGKNALAKHATKNIERLLKELNGDDEEPVASFEVLGINDVFDGIANKNQKKISLQANILDWSHVSSPFSAYFGIGDGLQLKNWWNLHGKRLVAKNIRYSLGQTDVNNQIRNTAIKNPEKFWYFNNGITLIADEVIKAPVSVASKSAGIFDFKGASIVNGAQTVSTLGRVENDNSLGFVRVPIRIIVLKDAPDDFGQEVTRTNNLQNRIEARDFVAQDPEQTRIQKEMSIEGIDYQFLRSEDFVPSPNACDLIEVTNALACASADVNHAVQVKTGIGRIFVDLKKAPYKALFNASLSGARTFNVTLVQRLIDQWIDIKKEEMEKRSGFSWGVLIHGNRVLAAVTFEQIKNSAFMKPIAEFRKNLDHAEIDVKCEQSHKAMVEVLEADYQGKFLAVLFKSPIISKEVFDKASKKTRLE